METIFVTSKTELAQTLRDVLAEREAAREKKTRTKSLTIHQVSKINGNINISQYEMILETPKYYLRKWQYS